MSAPGLTLVHVRAAGRDTAVAVHRARAPRVGVLLFVHGAGCDRHVADPLAEALPELDVIAPDLPGRGGTPGAPCASVAALAAFVGGVLDALDAPRAVVFGHSLGGGVALELAATRPLAGLVLASTGARLRVHPSVLEAMRVQASSSTESASLLGWSPGADPARIAAIDAHARAVPPATSLADWLAADAFDRLRALDAIDAPALVLAGADDPLTPPKYAQHLAATLRGARLEIFPGAGHMLPLDQAPRIAPRVRDFVAGLA